MKQNIWGDPSQMQLWGTSHTDVLLSYIHKSLIYLCVMFALKLSWSLPSISWPVYDIIISLNNDGTYSLDLGLFFTGWRNPSIKGHQGTITIQWKSYYKIIMNIIKLLRLVSSSVRLGEAGFITSFTESKPWRCWVNSYPTGTQLRFSYSLLLEMYTYRRSSISIQAMFQMFLYSKHFEATTVVSLLFFSSFIFSYSQQKQHRWLETPFLEI